MEDKILNDLDLHIMEAKDTNVISGGTLIEFSTSLLKKVTPVGFAIFVIDNWEDVKTGFSDGWNVR
jgi:hypothetical protein